MKTLKVYEVGVDPLPVDGTEVIVTSTTMVYDVFEMLERKEGEVVYMYGDIASTYTEAVDQGGFVTTDPTVIADWNEDSLAITVDVDNYGSLVDGDMWIYSHEFYYTLTGVFPFQCERTYNIAKAQGWLEEFSHEQTEPKEIDEDVYSWITNVVKFEGDEFSIRWSVMTTNTGRVYKSFLGFKKT